MNVLITGGAGFIGSHFVDYWAFKYPTDKIYVLDALTYAGNMENLSQQLFNPNFYFIEGHIGDKELVKDTIVRKGIAFLVNFAAETHVDKSIENPEKFIETNIVETQALLEACTGVLPHFHHVSTDEVYGSLEPDEPPFTEDSPYRPNSPYAASKAASDHLVRAYAKTYGLSTTISNCSNNFGWRQHPEKLIPMTITNLLERRTVPIYGDGKNTRDWLHVSDHCRAIDRIIRAGKRGETYNIGGHNEKTNLEIVYTICKLLEKRVPSYLPGGYESLITFVDDRKGHDRRYAIDSTKIETDLHFKVVSDFTHMLDQTIFNYTYRRSLNEK